MPSSIDFDTPPSSSAYNILATGTVAGWATARVMVKLTVSGTNLARSATQQVFYRAKSYNNTATSTALPVSETFYMAITPMIHAATETVAAVVNFGY